MATPDSDDLFPDNVPADAPADAPADFAAHVTAAKRSLVVNVFLYTVARLLLVAAIVGVMVGVDTLLNVEVPPILLLAVAVIIQLPLSHLLLAGLRGRLTAGMEVVGARRRDEKSQLRARLRGEDKPA